MASTSKTKRKNMAGVSFPTDVGKKKRKKGKKGKAKNGGKGMKRGY